MELSFRKGLHNKTGKMKLVYTERGSHCRLLQFVETFLADFFQIFEVFASESQENSLRFSGKSEAGASEFHNTRRREMFLVFTATARVPKRLFSLQIHKTCTTSTEYTPAK